MITTKENTQLDSKVVKILSNTYQLITLGLIVTALTSFFVEFSISGWADFLILVAVWFGSCLGASLLCDKNPLVAILSFLVMSVCGGLLVDLAVAKVSSDVVLLAVAGTAITFFSLTIYVLVTKKDFSGMGNYLGGALLLLIVVMIVNIFLNMELLSLIISYVAVLIFSGCILYDTSNIVTGKENNYIRASVGMYLNILNLFLHLLEILDITDLGDD